MFDVPEEERERSPFAAGLTAARGHLRYGLPEGLRAAGAFGMRQTPETSAAARAGLQASAARAQEQLPGGPAGISDVISGKSGVGRLIWENLAYSAPQMGTQLAAAMAGGVLARRSPQLGLKVATAGLTGATAAGTPFFVGSNVQRATEDGQKDLTPEQGTRSLLAAPAQSALDAVVQRFLPVGPLRHAFEGGILARTGKAIGSGAVTEAATEPLQQVGERFAAGLPVGDKAALSEYLEAAGTALLAGGAMGMFGGIRGLDPVSATEDELEQGIDQQVTPQGPPLALPSPDQFRDPLYVGEDGRVAQSPYEIDIARQAEQDFPVPQAQLALPAPSMFVDPQGRTGTDLREVGEAGRRRTDPNAEYPASTARLFADLDDDQVTQVLGDAEARIAAGEASPEEERVMRMARAELARRAVGADPQPEGGLLGPTRVDELLFGVKANQFVKKATMEAADEVDLADRLLSALENESRNNPVREGTWQLAEKMGLVDANRQPRDLDAELAEAEAAGADPAPLLATKALLDEVARRRTGPAQVEAVPDVDPDQAVLPLDEGLAPRYLAPEPEQRLGPMADQLRSVQRQMELQAAQREREAVEETQRDQDYEMARREVMAQNALSQEPVSETQAEVLWMRSKSASIKGWRRLTPKEKTQWIDILNQGVEGPELRITRSDISRGVPATTPVGVEDNALADIKQQIETAVPEDVRQYQDLNAEIDARFAPNVNVDPTGASRAGILKRLIAQRVHPNIIRQAIADAEAGLLDVESPTAVKPPAYLSDLEAKAPRTVKKVIQDVVSQPKSRAHKALLKEIDEAREKGIVSNVDRIRLLKMVREGREDEVMEWLDDETGTVESLNRADRGEVLKSQDWTTADTSGPIKPESQLGKILRQGDVNRALAHIADKSEFGVYRVIARALLKSGVGPFTVSIIDGADFDPDIAQNNGIPADAANSIQAGELAGFVLPDELDNHRIYLVHYSDWQTGLSERTFLHEAIHAFVAARWRSISVFGNPEWRAQYGLTGSEKAVELVDRLTDLWRDATDLLAKKYGDEMQGSQFSDVFHKPDEFLTYGLTSPGFMAELDTLRIDENGKVTTSKSVPTLRERFVDWIRDMLGMSPINRTQRTALDEVLSLGTNLLTAGERDAANFENVRRTQRRPLEAEILMERSTGTPRTIPGMTEATKAWAERGQELFDNLDTDGLRKFGLGWATLNHIKTRFGQLFNNADTNGLERHVKAHQDRATLVAQMSQIFSDAYHGWAKLNPKIADKVGELMSYTQFEIDPAKPWEEHKHLINGPYADVREKNVKAANKLYSEVREEGRAVYENFKAINEMLHTAAMATSLHNIISLDPKTKDTPGFEINPMDVFRTDETRRGSPIDARDYWRGELNRMITAADALVAADKTAMSPVKARLMSIRQNLTAMDQSPYFHLGRDGDWRVSFNIRLGEDKRVDPDAVKHVSEALAAAGFKDIEISPDTARSNVFIRLQNKGQATRLHQLAMELQKQKWLDQKVPVKAGLRTDVNIFGNEIQSEWLEQYIASIQADDTIPDDHRKKMISHARELWLDKLPDSAVSKVMVHRDSVPGFQKDMMRNFAFRAQVGIFALAGSAVSSELNTSYQEMRSAINTQTADNVNDDKPVASLTDRATMQNIVSELMNRDLQQANNDKNDLIRTLKAINHAFFLGFSPSYVAVNMTQLGVLLWPELAKKGSFVSAAKAIAKATPTAFKVLSATLKEGAKLGANRAADAVITAKVLQQSGIDQRTSEFVMRMVNTGNIDIGSASRELGRVTEGKIGSKTDTVLRYAAAAGYYSETLTRLIAALAAREVHGNQPDLDKYASGVVDQAMFNYANWNTARQLGRSGFAGPLTPVMTAFMQYSAQLIEKMHRELLAAYGGNKEARRFLGAHLIAMTTLAGTLGLPAASVFAMAADKLTDLFDDDDEPADIQTAWRTYLEDTFGKGLGDVLAHGLPRAANIDVSRRIGEQDIIPFTQLLTDKRKWEDASKDYALDMFGSPVSMLNSIVLGARDITEGNLMSGMHNMFPVALKSPLKAYEMSEKGYVDKQGNRLAMPVGAEDILAQALGFKSAEKARYDESKLAAAGRRTQLVREASNIRRNLAVAIEGEDNEAAREWLRRARQFDADAPNFAILPHFDQHLRQRAKARMISEMTHLPIGVSARDAAMAASGYQY